MDKKKIIIILVVVLILMAVVTIFLTGGSSVNEGELQEQEELTEEEVLYMEEYFESLRNSIVDGTINSYGEDYIVINRPVFQLMGFQEDESTEAMYEDFIIKISENTVFVDSNSIKYVEIPEGINGIDIFKYIDENSEGKYEKYVFIETEEPMESGDIFEGEISWSIFPVGDYEN